MSSIDRKKKEQRKRATSWTWPFEHPTDKRPCVVCGTSPVVLVSNHVEIAGSCSRCRAPYQFLTEDREVCERFECLLPARILPLARAAWSEGGIPILLPPFSDGVSFQIYLGERQHLIPPEPLLGDEPIEIWQVEGTGDDAHWLIRYPVPEDTGQTEHGPLVLEPKYLGNGTTVTINRGQK